MTRSSMRPGVLAFVLATWFAGGLAAAQDRERAARDPGAVATTRAKGNVSRPGSPSGSVDLVAAPVHVDFDAMPTSSPPRGFTIAQTAGGAPCVWVVKDDPEGRGGGRVLVQTDMNDTGGRFPLCIYDGVSVRDASVSVRFRTDVGDADRAAGLVVRYLDQDNYYCVRANSLEDNVRLYRVVDGRRIQFAGADRILTMEGRWHSLRLDARGSRFRVWMNDVFLFEATDDTFPDPGRTGLWLKGDSVTAFDDFAIGPPAVRRCADFETQAGPEPAGFMTEAIGGATPIRWDVVSDGSAGRGGGLVRPGRGDGGRRGGSVLLDEATVARDVSIAAGFRVVREGEGMRLAGLVARYVDESNHLYVRINLHECNLRLYRVSGGERRLVGEAHHLQFDPDVWHVAQLVAQGRRLAFLIDGKTQFEAHDDAPIAPGRVGLWAGTTGGAHYDDVVIETF